MPRILINEKDKTSPGTPSSYSNFSVLIVGFTGEDFVKYDASLEEVVKKYEDNNLTKPDSNGVFEFSSAQAFKDTIGLVAPKKSIEIENGSIDIYHYGNQMAYELLNMGYSIVFKPITAIQELTDENFWEIFKDKASYDFRFITHGLLESSVLTDEDSYNDVVQKLTDVEEAIALLEAINEQFKVDQAANPDLEEAEYKADAYAEIKNNYPGFKSLVDGKVYTDYAAAVAGTNADKVSLEETKNTLTAGGITTEMINSANVNIANLATPPSEEVTGRTVPGRGDCIALIELDEKVYAGNSLGANPENLIISAISSMNGITADNGKYCAMTVPSVHYKMADNKVFENNKKFPGAFHYLACFINSLKLGFSEWYAAAGYTRGVSSYTIDHATVRLGEIAINALEPRNYDDPQSDYPKFACNVIANFRGSYYLWGNRTAHPLGKKGNLDTGDLVASSFLNIRQLCTTIKKQLYTACRTFTFDPNSDTLWVNFCNAIRPTLEAMKADQGIRDYKILKVYTDRKATLKAKIRIIPIEAVEDFDLEVSLEDSFGETAVVVTE